MKSLTWEEFCGILGNETRFFSSNNLHMALDEALRQVQPLPWNGIKSDAERDKHLDWIHRYNMVYRSLIEVVMPCNGPIVTRFRDSECAIQLYLRRIDAAFAKEVLSRIPKREEGNCIEVEDFMTSFEQVAAKLFQGTKDTTARTLASRQAGEPSPEISVVWTVEASGMKELRTTPTAESAVPDIHIDAFTNQQVLHAVSWDIATADESMSMATIHDLPEHELSFLGDGCCRKGRRLGEDYALEHASFQPTNSATCDVCGSTETEPVLCEVKSLGNQEPSNNVAGRTYSRPEDTELRERNTTPEGHAFDFSFATAPMAAPDFREAAPEVSIQEELDNATRKSSDFREDDPAGLAEPNVKPQVLDATESYSGTREGVMYRDDYHQNIPDGVGLLLSQYVKPWEVHDNPQGAYVDTYPFEEFERGLRCNRLGFLADAIRASPRPVTLPYLYSRLLKALYDLHEAKLYSMPETALADAWADLRRLIPAEYAADMPTWYSEIPYHTVADPLSPDLVDMGEAMVQPG